MTFDTASNIGNIIIGGIGLLLMAWPLLSNSKSEVKYFEYPFMEYDSLDTRRYLKNANYMWRIYW